MSPPLDTTTRPPFRGLVIMPAFNESGSVARVVGKLKEHLPDFDILVVDDGSTDGTFACVPANAKAVSLPFNLGIGGAMQTGYRYAAIHGYDLAVQVDADGQHPPESVARLVAHLHETGADMVIGSRFLEPGHYEQTLSRMAGIRVLRAIIRLITGTTITDCTSGFRVVNRRVINAFAHWYPDDYPEPEVVLLLLRAGMRIVEMPTSMHQRTTGQTSISLLRGIFYVAKVSTCLILDTIRKPWPAEKVKPQ